jgi:voltage-gated potassium channel
VRSAGHGISRHNAAVPPSALAVAFPRRNPSAPTVAVLRRFLLALGIVAVNWLLVVVERDGYRDSHDGTVSVADALYYTTVTLTTTGYGDITPVTTGARLVNALVVTPMRLLFVILLVGTTIQALTERSRDQMRLTRWRARVRDHVVICGYGTKGRNAARALLLKGHPQDRIVVIDPAPAAAADATAAGLVAVLGSATRPEALRQARVERASVVIVALDRDDAAILATLTARRIAPGVTVVASAREAANGDLLRQSGATSVIVSSETAGRLLGLAAESPQTVDVVEDMLSFGEGLDLLARDITGNEVGRRLDELGVPVLAVVRGGGLLRYSDPEAGPLVPGDRILYVAS